MLIIADDLVVEAFAFQDSLRVPRARLGVRVRPDKHDHINVQFGYASIPGQPLYGADVNLTPGSKGFTLPGEDEPRLREFFASLPEG